MNFKQFFTIAFGSNLTSSCGGPRQNLCTAVEKLCAKGLKIKAMSRHYKTPAFPEGIGPDYVNFVVEFEALMSPHAVLELAHSVEAELGRRREKRWADRTVDIDLLAQRNEILPDVQTVSAWIGLSPEDQQKTAPKQLLLPHPRLQDRAFVLIPWADIAPNWHHPILCKTVTEMLADLPQKDRDQIIALPDLPAPSVL